MPTNVHSYKRPVFPINQVDFSTPHNPDQFLHYKFAIYNNGYKKWLYETSDKTNQSIVYRGEHSYHERKGPDEFHRKTLRNTQPNKETTIVDEAFLQQQMSEILAMTEA